MSITVGSLFAGIGGIELGLERTGGFETVWQVEKDDYCRRVLAKHWPDVNRYERVEDVGADNLEPVDLICGGFPCQDISLAGGGEGIEGERSGLWSEMWRCVRELRPRYALVENVPALRSRGLGRVLGDLAEVGYDAEWDCLPAAAFGAPHRRDRIFLVAYPHEDAQRLQPVSERRGREAPEPGDDGTRGAVADPDGQREGDEAEGVPARQPEPRGSGADVSDADRERGGEGTRIPDERRPRLPDADGNRPEVPNADEPRLEARIFGAGREGPLGESQRQGRRAERQWEAEPDVGRVADGIPDRVDRLRALGNAVVPQVAEWIGEQILRAEGHQ